MAGLTQAFGIATAALEADQQAINTTANNVGNANTPGYTRQIAVFQENDPITIQGLQYGRGASVTSIDSQRDRVLEQRIQQQQQTLSASSTRLNALNSIAAIFAPAQASGADSNTGVGGAIDGFFTAVNSLQANPEDPTIRQSVLTAAGNFASSLRAVSTQLDGEASALQLNVAGDVGAVNSLTATIATLNREIQTSSPHGDAGVLEDQRQQAVLQLSKLIDVVPIQTENNGLTLTTSGGAMLVSEGAANVLTTATVGGATHVFAAGVDITATIHAGQIGGALAVTNTDLPALRSNLDSLAFSFATAVNSVLMSGVDANGVAGTALFTLSPGPSGAAASIGIAITDPAKIAAAAVGQGPGDNQNAVTLSSLATSGIISGITPINAYSSLVGGVGEAVRGTTIQNTSVDASLQQLTSQRNSLSGVSENEEAANLQTFERSYQIASKLFSILDSILGAALNLGVAGVAVQQ